MRRGHCLARLFAEAFGESFDQSRCASAERGTGLFHNSSHALLLLAFHSLIPSIKHVLHRHLMTFEYLGKNFFKVKREVGKTVMPQLLVKNVAQTSCLQAGCLRYSTCN